MPKRSVVRPLGELHFADELRPHPVRPPSERLGRRIDEWALGRGEGVELRAQLERERVRETGSDFARVHELSSGVVVADQERSDSRARTLGLREAADHELLPQDALHFLPARIAPRKAVDSLAPLRHDPLEPHGARALVDGLAVADQVRRVANESFRIGAYELLEAHLALFERKVREIVSFEEQKIEDEVNGVRGDAVRERVLQHLKARLAARIEHGDFTVEKRRPEAELADGARHIRKSRRPVLIAAADELNGTLRHARTDAVAVVLRFV